MFYYCSKQAFVFRIAFAVLHLSTRTITFSAKVDERVRGLSVQCFPTSFVGEIFYNQSRPKLFSSHAENITFMISSIHFCPVIFLGCRAGPIPAI